MLQADGGTRTAAICGAYVALADAVRKLPATVPAMPGAAAHATRPARYDPAKYDPSRALVEQVAAVSVGVVDGEVRLDLDYNDDSRAEVDMNIAYTAGGRFVEVQGSAEQAGGFDRGKLNQMLDSAIEGCGRIMELQRHALSQS